VLHVTGVPPTYWSGGYQGLDLEINVAPNVLNSYTAELPPLAPIPIPWYVWAGIGAAGIVSTYALLRPRIPAVIVVGERRII